MKTKVVVIGNEFLVTGMRLAGVSEAIVVDKDGFQDAMERVTSDKTYGVVIVPESMYNLLDWRMRKRLEVDVHPVIIQIPEPGVESEESGRIRALIKRAIGFDVMAKKN